MSGLPLTAERRRKQKEAYRRRKGIPAKERRTTKWVSDYMAIWSKPPGVPLTEEEFAQREPLWNRWCAERQKEG